MERFSTPILFIIFNRYDTAIQVFEKIRQIQPEKLYVVADGPRKDHPEDKENCEKVRNIIKQIDWDCELKILFRDENLGCGLGPKQAISWFFENEQQGIILEDDCLAGEDFFWYCQDLLNRYKDTQQVKIISGDNFQGKSNWNGVSYSYNSVALIWGWATWRRTWQEYEYDLKKYSLKELMSYYKPYSLSKESRLYWQYRAMQSRSGKLDSVWDYQLQFSIWKNKGLNIIPSSNLVTNIGFGQGATHKFKNIEKFIVKTYPLLPLKYNDNIVQNIEADKWYHNRFNKKAVWKYPLLYLKLLLGR